MYKILKYNRILLGLKIFILIVGVNSALKGCWSGPQVSTLQTPVAVRGTWQGTELRGQDTVFHKLTFLPGNRYRIISLFLPAWRVEESSGFLVSDKENYYKSSSHDFSFDVLSEKSERLYIRFLRKNKGLVELRPLQSPLVEKAWALVLIIGPAGDSLSLNRKQKIVLRFRADNFGVLSLANGPNHWGYYFLKGDSVYLRPTQMDSLPKLLQQGFYRYQAYRDTLILRSRQGEELVFNRRLF